MTTTLEDRIASAVVETRTSEELSALLQEVSTAEQTAQSWFTKSQATAFDPAVKTSRANQARNEMETAGFTVTRMAAAKEKLAQLRDEAKERERAALSAAQLAEAERERDALVEELSDVYPAVAEKLADLLGRIERNNAKLGRQAVEAIARGAPADWEVNPRPSLPSLVRGLRLPTFKLDLHSTGYEWDGLRGR